MFAVDLFAGLEVTLFSLDSSCKPARMFLGKVGIFCIWRLRAELAAEFGFRSI